ncbi:MAG: hypothetical protein GQ574_15190 [Crocinitomix sp.]|nr:hypothetical protein [Crocinitomix sp.]
MNYSFYNKIILRTPLNPVKTEFSEEELRELYGQESISEALFLASPDLHNECQKWLEGIVLDEDDRVKMSLLKYASRLHTRPTPFGLFAKCSIAKWGAKTEIKIDHKRLFRSTKLDMNFSCQLAYLFSKDSLVQPYLLFFPNNSLYEIQDEIRYTEYYYKNETRAYRISSIDNSDYIQALLKAAESGAAINDLIDVLKLMDEEVTSEEAEQFILQLIEAQILTSEMEPSVSGEETLNDVLITLERIWDTTQNEKLKNYIEFLKSIKKELGLIDGNLFNSVEKYKKLAKSLDQLAISYKLGKLFQTDLFEATNEANIIGYDVQKSLKRALRIVNKMTPRSEGKPQLMEFKNRFYERYQDTEVPLLIALDNETGIGYARNNNKTGDSNPLVHDLAIPGEVADSRDQKWQKFDSFLMGKLTAAYQNNEQIIHMEEKDLGSFEEDWSSLSDSISTIFSHVDNGKILLKSTGGTSAVNLLGRFGAGHSEIKNIMDEISEHEKALKPNAILAEIVYLPRARTGNVLARPQFRDYEIPYLAKSFLPRTNQIQLEDLYLSIDNNQQIKLRSKRLNKEVIPRLANAHNYSSKSLPIYHFLCDLQNRNQPNGIFFDWGNLSTEFKFFPRVQVENVILAPATWKLNKNDVKSLLAKGVDIIKEVAQLKEKWKLPDLISFTEGDNELLVNLKNQLSLKIFLKSIKNKPLIVLKEFLFQSKNDFKCEQDSTQTFANECIAILTKNQVAKEEVEERVEVVERFSESSNLNVQRDFAIGSEWLYYKVFCGLKTADEILTKIVKPLTEKWRKAGLIKNWFFIRYGSPDFHLRIRFQLCNKQDLGIVISDFHEHCSNYIESKLIWKLETDGYQRELERYGSNTIEIAEQIFYYDSANIISVLELLDEGLEGEKVKWLYTLKLIDALLDAFQFDLIRKKNLMTRLRNGFGEEFNMNKHLNKQIDKKYRAHKDEIHDLFNDDSDLAEEFAPLFDLLKLKMTNIQPLITTILAEFNEAENAVLENQISSYMHMSINRIFRSKQRLHELVIYDFLRKKYSTDYGRKN